MIRIMIVDDHEIVLRSWKSLLENNPAFSVVGQYSNGRDAIKDAEKLPPDIMLVDIKMSPMNGFELTSLVTQKFPTIKVIGLSVNNLPSYASKMIQMGARGYLTKTSSLKEINHAINEVKEGRVYICEEVKNKMNEL